MRQLRCSYPTSLSTPDADGSLLTGQENSSSLARRAFDRGQDLADLSKNEWRNTMVFTGVRSS